MSCTSCKRRRKRLHSWDLTVCADGNVERVLRLCDACDVRMNAYVLRMAGDPDAAKKMREYKQR